MTEPESMKRSAAAALDSQFPIAEALYSQSKLSSLIQSDQYKLQRIEGIIKDMLGNFTKYRRIITTSNGYIGTAHSQVRKGDKIYSLQGSSIPYVVLRAENLPLDELSKINENIEKIRSRNEGTILLLMIKPRWRCFKLRYRGSFSGWYSTA